MTTDEVIEAVRPILRKLADTFGADDNGEEWPHDEDPGRTCSPESPQGCVICEARAVLARI